MPGIPWEKPSGWEWVRKELSHSQVLWHTVASCVGNIFQAKLGPTECNSYAAMKKNQVKVVSD